jgi:hypothetical protein
MVSWFNDEGAANPLSILAACSFDRHPSIEDLERIIDI